MGLQHDEGGGFRATGCDPAPSGAFACLTIRHAVRFYNGGLKDFVPLAIDQSRVEAFRFEPASVRF